jgi:hypothetical protein
MTSNNYDLKTRIMGGRKKSKGNVTERVNWFKVHCAHVWNYHNGIPLYYYFLFARTGV